MVNMTSPIMGNAAQAPAASSDPSLLISDIKASHLNGHDRDASTTTDDVEEGKETGGEEEEGEEEEEEGDETTGNGQAAGRSRGITEEDELEIEDKPFDPSRYTKEQKGKWRAPARGPAAVEDLTLDISPFKNMFTSSDPLARSSSPEADLYTRPSPRPRPPHPISSVSSPSIQSVSPFSIRRSKALLEVEVIFLPLKQLRTYHHPPNLSRPTEESRLALLPSVYNEMSLSRSSSPASVLPRQQPKRSRWRVTSSPPLGSEGELGGYGTEDEDGDDESMSETGSDSSGRPTRRMTRATLRGTKIGNGRAQMLTRNARHQTRASTVSEHSFYGTNTRMAPRQRPPPRKIRRLDEEEYSSPSIVSDGSEGEEEVDSEEYDELEENETDEDSDEYGKKKNYKRSQAEVRKNFTKALKAHRPFCEKCRREPADVILERALALKKRPGKRRKLAEGEISDEELAQDMEGWLECKTCVLSSHWGCLSAQQKKDVLTELLDQEGPLVKRKSLAIDETATFKCSRCTADPTCYACHQDTLKPEAEEKVSGGENKAEDGDSDIMEVDPPEIKTQPLKFRCVRCRLGFHYEHMKDPFNDAKRHSLQERADWYQNSYVKSEAAWTCHLCREWIWTVDLILAWRPLPANAKEDPRDADEKPFYKDALPREYLVKWTARGFRHVTWVPHSWLQILSPTRLRHFLEKGPSLDLVTDETLAARGDDMIQPTIARITEEDDLVKGRKGRGHHTIKDEWEGHGPPPDVNAESSIPVEWKTVDRVLDIMLLPPKPNNKKIDIKRRQRVLSDSASEMSEKAGILGGSATGLPDGLMPPPEKRLDIDLWEEAAGRDLTEDDLDEVAPLVTWCFFKWDDLQYDQSCWDTPPPLDSPLYPAFKRALGRFLKARHVDIPVLSAAQAKKRDKDAEGAYQPPDEQPDCVVGGKLMPFQLEGLQWLLYKHFKRESCILADDMGLGKTIQIASLLGCLGSSEMRIYPCLVVVPNSTITNWVREFEKWVPHVRVVPYYGEAASRKIIAKYELYHKGLQGKAAGLKAHIVLTTYDMITGSEFRVFSGIPRWELLCIDEGQRLKSDDSLIFNRLKTLNTVHRILLTGTPLNNNIRELFNLLSFLDPDNFTDLHELQTRFDQDDLNEGKLQELHDMIKPYILRRIKADVLKLPPKVEIIVPISLAPLQKQVYKSILERNAELLKAIADAKRKRISRGVV
ncbi:SNF2 family N-terminal domain-domain-containing protein [Naematelia encephala]|uniref:SNF2 family N-terminal domain-domain-containing protein n=1 Tax=Naematelia encephala TaxID=71784 RepID=A0A1Y2B7S8_9TREE|nr:SNF2 family N-terminal domain-domain-containing protein [Naematelia encephala]